MKLDKLFSIIYLAIGILFSTVLFSQKRELIDDLKKSNSFYVGATSLYMDVKYEVFENYTTKTLSESYSGFYKKKGKFFYSKMLGIATVNNDKVCLAVNDEEKIILIGNSQKATGGQLNFPIDTLINHCKSVKVINVSATTKVYEVVLDNLNTELEKLLISFDLKTTLVTKLVLFYKEAQVFDDEVHEGYEENVKKQKPRVEISYQNIKVNQTISDGDFSETKFVALFKNKYKGNGSYLNYRIVDQSKH